MKITVFGAAGDVGSRIVAEALNRGHEVRGVVRNADQFTKLADAVSKSVGDAGQLMMWFG